MSNWRERKREEINAKTHIVERRENCEEFDILTTHCGLSARDYEFEHNRPNDRWSDEVVGKGPICPECKQDFEKYVEDIRVHLKDAEDLLNEVK